MGEIGPYSFSKHHPGNAAKKLGRWKLSDAFSQGNRGVRHGAAQDREHMSRGSRKSTVDRFSWRVPPSPVSRLQFIDPPLFVDPPMPISRSHHRSCSEVLGLTIGTCGRSFGFGRKTASRGRRAVVTMPPLKLQRPAPPPSCPPS